MLIAILAARPWLGSTEGRESAQPRVTASAPASPAPLPAPSTLEPTPVATEAPQPTESGAAVANDRQVTPTAANDRQVTPAARPVRLTVVKAQLCAELADWHCDPPDRPIPSGQLFFYTQVRSASATTVQHRWYQGDRLQHSVELRVEASPTVGYRSFSRYLMKNGNGGNWRVELRTVDGVLLQEERFSVQ